MTDPTTAGVAGIIAGTLAGLAGATIGFTISVGVTVDALTSDQIPHVSRLALATGVLLATYGGLAMR